MKREIGDTFEYEGHTLQVVEQKKCKGCFFENQPCHIRRYNITGSCCIVYDGTFVIFKEVTEPEKDAQADETANADAANAADAFAAADAQGSSLTAHGSLPLSTPVHMTDEQKRDTLNAISHESIIAFSELYANFIIDCEKVGIRVSGVEFYADDKAGKPQDAKQP